MFAVVGCIWLRDDEAKCSLADEDKCSLAVSDMVVVVVVAEDVTIADDGLSGLWPAETMDDGDNDELMLLLLLLPLGEEAMLSLSR